MLVKQWSMSTHQILLQTGLPLHFVRWCLIKKTLLTWPWFAVSRKATWMNTLIGCNHVMIWVVHKHSNLTMLQFGASRPWKLVGCDERVCQSRNKSNKWSSQWQWKLTTTDISRNFLSSWNTVWMPWTSISSGGCHHPHCRQDFSVKHRKMLALNYRSRLAVSYKLWPIVLVYFLSCSSTLAL